MTPQRPDLHVFVIRARREPREIAGAPAEWRFWIEHHPGGAQRHFQNFAEVLAFMAEHLPADAASQDDTLPPETVCHGCGIPADASYFDDSSIVDAPTITSPIPLRCSTKQEPPTIPVAILRGTAQVGSFARQSPVLKSAAGQAACVLRIVDGSWRQLIAKVGEGSPAWTGGAHELRLQRHARRFKIKASYSRCP